MNTTAISLTADELAGILARNESGGNRQVPVQPRMAKILLRGLHRGFLAAVALRAQEMRRCRPPRWNRPPADERDHEAGNRRLIQQAIADCGTARQASPAAAGSDLSWRLAARGPSGGRVMVTRPMAMAKVDAGRSNR